MRPLASMAVGGAPRQRKLSYRNDSPGDRGVIEQIWGNDELSIDGLPLAFRVQRFYSDLVRAGSKPLILDAGANIGASAVWFSLRYPEARIVAIEPEPGNCQLLRTNTEGLDCEIVEAGLGSCVGRLFLTDPGLSDWGFRLDSKGEVEVPVVPASRVVADALDRGATPFIAKIDIEGGESSLFAQDTDWVAQFPLLVVELHDWMLPGEATSRTFHRLIGGGNYDCVARGEHNFCFNLDRFQRAPIGRL